MGEAWWGRAHTLEIPTRSRRVLYCDRANATDRLKSGALGQAGPGRGASASLPSPASELGVRWVSRALERALSPGPCLCCGTQGRGWCPLPQRRTPGPRALQGHLDRARLLPGQLGWGPGGSFWLQAPSTDLTGRRCSPAHLVRQGTIGSRVAASTVGRLPGCRKPARARGPAAAHVRSLSSAREPPPAQLRGPWPAPVPVDVTLVTFVIFVPRCILAGAARGRGTEEWGRAGGKGGKPSRAATSGSGQAHGDLGRNSGAPGSHFLPLHVVSPWRRAVWRV